VDEQAPNLVYPTAKTPRVCRGVVVMDMVLEQAGFILGAVISPRGASVKHIFKVNAWTARCHAISALRQFHRQWFLRLT